MSCPLITPVFLLLTFLLRLTLGEVYSFEPPNLKTVLFKETDLLTRCWSKHEVNLLLNRRVMQDLIPRKIPRDFPLLLKYLQSLEHLAAQIPPGLNQTLVMAAMADVMGGYLSAIVLPIANEAFYAGTVDYNTVNALHLMLDRWKWYLSTDGGTWSQQCDMRHIPTKVAALELNLDDPEGACKQLYVAANNNESQAVGSQTLVAENSRVAIPYFDNNKSPNAIALPFRSRNLFGLTDPDATSILVKYYTLSMRCLTPNPNDVLAFSNFFHVWIMSKVVPRLHDHDRWYPALGGVMQVVETIRQRGLAPTNTVFVPPLSDDHLDTVLSANIDVGGAEESLKHTGVSGSYFQLYNNPYAILVLMVLFLISFALLCCCCLCAWLLCRRKKKKHNILFDTDENVLKNTLLSIYCGMKDALRDSGSGSASSDPGQQIRASDPPQRTRESEPSRKKYSSPRVSPQKVSVPRGSGKRSGETPKASYIPADPQSDTDVDTTSEGSTSVISPSDDDRYSSSTRPASSK